MQDTLTLEGKCCLNWGRRRRVLGYVMKVEVRKSRIPRRESICPDPEVSDNLPILEAGVCVCVHTGTHMHEYGQRLFIRQSEGNMVTEGFQRTCYINKGRYKGSKGLHQSLVSEW